MILFTAYFSLKQCTVLISSSNNCILDFGCIYRTWLARCHMQTHPSLCLTSIYPHLLPYRSSLMTLLMSQVRFPFLCVSNSFSRCLPSLQLLSRSCLIWNVINYCVNDSFWCWCYLTPTFRSAASPTRQTRESHSRPRLTHPPSFSSHRQMEKMQQQQLHLDTYPRYLLTWLFMGAAAKKPANETNLVAICKGDSLPHISSHLWVVSSKTDLLFATA